MNKLTWSPVKILYLHGMDSFLQDDRREILQPYGEIYAPTLHYRNTPNLFQKLEREYAEIQAIIGSSAGGLIGYYLAQTLKKPCLLFNPALCFRNEMPIPTQFDPTYRQYMQIAIGLQDQIIDPWASLSIIKEDISDIQNVEIHLINTMEHSYPIELFSNEVSIFFDRMKQK